MRYVCSYTHTYIYIIILNGISVNMEFNIIISSNLKEPTHVCMYVCTYVCTYKYMYKCMYLRMCIVSEFISFKV